MYCILQSRISLACEILIKQGQKPTPSQYIETKLSLNKHHIIGHLFEKKIITIPYSPSATS